MPEYTGVFNGNDYTISNLFIDRIFQDQDNRQTTNGDYLCFRGSVLDEHYVGLFGRLSSGARVENLGLVSANVGGCQYAGALAGQITETVIEGSYATGEVQVISYSSGEYNAGQYLFVGGLVGQVWFRSSIKRSYANVNVDVQTNRSSNVGGLTGYNRSSSSIINSYATGTVSGQMVTGGLVGFNYGTIRNSYATGQVNSTASGEPPGGLTDMGSFPPTRVHDSYWDTETSGRSGSGGGTGKTTEQLQNPTSATGIYANWSADVWDFGTSSEYPTLK